MEPSSSSWKQIIEGARYHTTARSYIAALRLLVELSSSHPLPEETKEDEDYLEGEIFMELAKGSDHADLSFTFLFGSMSSFGEILNFPAYCAKALFDLAEIHTSLFYYKKAYKKSKIALGFLNLPGFDFLEYKREMGRIIRKSESKLSRNMTASMPFPPPIYQQIAVNWEENEKLSSFWAGLSVDFRREFMKVSINELGNYLGEQEALNQLIRFVKKKQRWCFWICRTCSEKFLTSEACTCHIEQQHMAEFKPSLRTYMPKRIEQLWADMICVGDWEPVDAVGSVQMIKNRFEDVKVFEYKDGWCKDWSVAEDKERSTLLKEIRLLLLSLIKHKVLSVGIIDCVVHIVVRQLEKLDVSKKMLTDCRLLETPQSICFLECAELSVILVSLRKIKCTRDDGIDIVSRTVDCCYQSTRVKERIDFDSQFSLLLLDKRLLKGRVDHFDGEGIVKICDPAVHCASVHSRGDYLVTWLNEHFTRDGDEFGFPKPINTHNFDIWMAVLRAVQFKFRTMGTKYAKKSQFLEYDEALTEARKVCQTEILEGDGDAVLTHEARELCQPEALEDDAVLTHEAREVCQPDILKDGAALTEAGEVCRTERRASLLYDRCTQIGTTKVFLCAVLDVLKGGEMSPAFDLSNSKDEILKIIREKSKTATDTAVSQSIEHLQYVVKEKVALIDSKILLTENSRVDLLNDLTRLAFFDYRSYILRPLKKFLLATLKRRFQLEGDAVKLIRDMIGNMAETLAIHSYDKQ